MSSTEKNALQTTGGKLTVDKVRSWNNKGKSKIIHILRLIGGTLKKVVQPFIRENNSLIKMIRYEILQDKIASELVRPR